MTKVEFSLSEIARIVAAAYGYEGDEANRYVCRYSATVTVKAPNADDAPRVSLNVSRITDEGRVHAWLLSIKRPSDFMGALRRAAGAPTFTAWLYGDALSVGDLGRLMLINEALAFQLGPAIVEGTTTIFDDDHQAIVDTVLATLNRQVARSAPKMRGYGTSFAAKLPGRSR